MTTTTEITAENSSLFEIDKELEAAFNAAAQEQEQTGTIAPQTASLTGTKKPLAALVANISRHITGC